MFDRGSYFDPLEAEAVIDDAYRSAEKLPDNIQERYEKILDLVEDAVYSLTEDGKYTQTEIEDSRRGIELLQDLEEQASEEHLDDILEARELENLTQIVETQGTKIKEK